MANVVRVQHLYVYALYDIRCQLLNFILASILDDHIVLTVINLNFHVVQSLLFPVISEQSVAIFGL